MRDRRSDVAATAPQANNVVERPSPSQPTTVTRVRQHLAQLSISEPSSYASYMSAHLDTSSHIDPVSTAKQLLPPAPRAAQRPHLDIPNIDGHRAAPHHERASRTNTSTSESYLVISGGTGCNAICAAFARASYVLPVSDDGGSSSEIIRVLGGPSIGIVHSLLICSRPTSRVARAQVTSARASYA